MDNIRVLSVFGTRPEAVKMLPLVKQISITPGLEGVVCVTAQHREMLDQVMNVFNAHADYDLNLMKPGQTHTSIIADGMTRLEPVLKEVEPDLVLVHGDTITSFLTALAAFYQKITVGHVEAGLRTFNRYSPYPEEMHRLLTSKLATLHFAPTRLNVENLARENITEGVYLTGNTVIDALKDTVRDNYTFDSPELRDIPLDNDRIILVTAHRYENLGERMYQMFGAIRNIADAFSDVRVVYPIHKNPAVRVVANEILSGHPRIHLIESIDVQDMHNLQARCYMVMTDSGGLQEEAPALGKPVLVLRTETERPEAVEAGTVKVVGVEFANIFNEAHRLLTDTAEYSKMSKAVNPYGDGHASRRICEAIKKYYSIN